MPHYGRAPIVEAVIELRLETPIAIKQLEKLRDRMKKSYPAVKDRMNIRVHVEAGKSISAQSTPTGFQMNSADGVDVIMLQTTGISASRLAPYRDWPSLTEKLSACYEQFVKIFGRLPFDRASARYINRIDIRNDIVAEKEVRSFFRIGIQAPDDLFTRCSAFSATANVVELETGLGATVSVGPTASPLIDHQSFAIDIDVHTVEKLPLRVDDMWTSIDRLRIAKNNIFEKSISDDVRKIIS